MLEKKFLEVRRKAEHMIETYAIYNTSGAVIKIRKAKLKIADHLLYRLVEFRFKYMKKGFGSQALLKLFLTTYIIKLIFF